MPSWLWATQGWPHTKLRRRTNAAGTLYAFRVPFNVDVETFTEIWTTVSSIGGWEASSEADPILHGFQPALHISGDIEDITNRC